MITLRFGRLWARSIGRLVDRRGLWAQKNGLDGIAAPHKTKRLQFVSMSVYLQNRQEKCQHDRGIDQGP
ncbi:hypothetical protein AC629_01215 [Bradyrhizobium sp. NAS80.1]|nr:hypothetical protein AC629_01215 [Bradyrhizobium sp. NAS80.1]